MKLLLDTHIWLWAASEPERLNASLHAALTNTANERVISVASFWEISIKAGLGKIDLGPDLNGAFEAVIRTLDAHELPVTRRHVLGVAALPLHHRDPFDRMLVAQALTEGATLVTADNALRDYSVPLLWAGP